jgi:uncharacterized damage-inducible protein DinB
MTIAEPFVAELTREAATTRRVLERVPEDKLSWRPHAKSMSLGQLAMHVATIPSFVSDLISVDQFELTSSTPEVATSRAALLTALDRTIAHATRTLTGMGDARMMAEWKLTRAGRTLLTLPRVGVVRGLMLNHWYHHRGQLSVYLRLLDVPVPSIYGPSADENPFA